MTGAVALSTGLTEAYVSEESAQIVEVTAKLLSIGRETGVPTSLFETENIIFEVGAADRFRRLKERWKEETRYLSSIQEMVLHPAYQQIIGMGREALPFIFKELRQQPDHWFWALEAITGEDPVPPVERHSHR